MWESLQRVFLYVFGLPEFNSELYFSENFLVPALGNLSTLRVQHCTLAHSDKWLTRSLSSRLYCLSPLPVYVHGPETIESQKQTNIGNSSR